MICSHINELFRNEHGAVYQCSKKNCYWLEFNGERTAFTVSDFLRFRENVNAIDIESILINPSRTADYTILMPFRCSRCFLLSAIDVVNLKEILSAARFMIELNSLLSVCLKTRSFRVLS